MAEKAKAKKAKTVSKKTSVKSKKRNDQEQEELQLQVEEMPKRSVKAKAASPAERTVAAPVLALTEVEPIAEVLKVKATQNIAVREEKEIKTQTTPEIIAPIQPRVVVNKPETPRQEPVRADYNRPETKRPDAENDGLRLKLSQSLTKKLKEQAADEGISLEEFVSELLAESVVLRAWEIVERKNAMKGHQPQTQTHQRPNNNNNNRDQGGANRGGQRGNNQSNKGHRGMSHVRYQTIMDDKATFLEYVRSQEKPRR